MYSPPWLASSALICKNAHPRCVGSSKLKSWFRRPSVHTPFAGGAGRVEQFPPTQTAHPYTAPPCTGTGRRSGATAADRGSPTSLLAQPRRSAAIRNRTIACAVFAAAAGMAVLAEDPMNCDPQPRSARPARPRHPADRLRPRAAPQQNHWARLRARPDRGRRRVLQGEPQAEGLPP
jgi:hypothetical protein